MSGWIWQKGGERREGGGGVRVEEKSRVTELLQWQRPLKLSSTGC